MARKNRTPEKQARREKICEMLQLANIGSMNDIRNLFKEAIAELMENGLEEELSYSKYDYQNRETATAARHRAPASGMWKYLFLGIARENSNPRCRERIKPVSARILRKRYYPMYAYAKGMAANDIEAIYKICIRQQGQQNHR